MTLRSQLYLLQLEDYDLDRYQAWIKNNPGREVVEKKGKIRWSWKARNLYVLGKFFGLESALKFISPIDESIKKILIWAAKTKLNLFHRNLITVGVTGSWGKTTMKEKLAVVLGTKFEKSGVFRTFGNHNTLIGVAVDVLKMPLSTQFFICEMGAFRVGDIRDICELVRPKVGIITAIGPMHLERFGSLAAIKETKYELKESLPGGGLFIGPEGNPIKEVCKYFNLNYTLALTRLKSLPPVAHRLEVMEAKRMKIIDDSYNSNPAGFIRALGVLEGTSGSPKKILVSPGMIELGKVQFEENRKVAGKSVEVADEIIFVGLTNREAWVKGLGGYKKVHFVKDMDEAKEILTVIAKPGAVVLFENDLPDQYF